MPITMRFDTDPMLATLTGLNLGRKQRREERERQRKLEEQNEGSLGGLGAGVGTILGVILAIPTGGLSLAAGAALGGAAGGVAGSFVKTKGKTAQTLNTVGGAAAQLASVAVQMQEKKFVADNVKRLATESADLGDEARLSLWETAAMKGELGPQLQQRAIGNVLKLASEVSYQDIRDRAKGKVPTEDEQQKIENTFRLLAEANDPSEVVTALAESGGVPKDVYKRYIDIARLQIGVLEDKKKMSASQAKGVNSVLDLYAQAIDADPDGANAAVATTSKRRRELGLSTSSKALAFAGGPDAVRAFMAQQMGEQTTGRSIPEMVDQMVRLGRNTTAANGYSSEQIAQVAKNVQGARQIASGPLPKLAQSQFLAPLVEETRAITPAQRRSDERSQIEGMFEFGRGLVDPATGVSVDEITEGGRTMKFNRGAPTFDPKELKAQAWSPDGIPLDREGNMPQYVTPFDTFFDNELAMLKQKQDFALANIPIDDQAAKAALADRIYPEDLSEQIYQKWLKRYADKDFLESQRRPTPEPAAPTSGAQPGAAEQDAAPPLNEQQQRSLGLALTPDATLETQVGTLTRVMRELQAAGRDPASLPRRDLMRLSKLHKAVQRAQAQEEAQQRALQQAPRAGISPLKRSTP